MEAVIGALVTTWGEEAAMEAFVAVGFGEAAGDAPRADAAFIPWLAKLARYAATPTSYAAFDRVWYETDVRDVLPAVQAPTAVLYKLDPHDWGSRAHAEYLAQRLPAAQVVGVPGSAGVVWVEDPEPIASAIERFLASVRDEEATCDRVLATVLFTDIVASTATA